MHKETITYNDYNGVERTEDFYFNLTEAELTEMEYGQSGGMTSAIEHIIASQDLPTLIQYFKQIILKSYGEKSLDGKYFLKEDDEGHKLARKFTQTEAYSILYMKLATNDEAAANFVNGIMPKNVKELAEKKNLEITSKTA